MGLFVSHTLNLPGDHAYIVPLGDSHEGAVEFTDNGERKLQGYADWVLERENAYAALVGDLLSGQTSAGPGTPKDETLGYDEQVDRVFERFLPLFKEGRILWINRGNHCDKVERQAGINHDPMHRLVKMWDREVRYDVKRLYGGYESLVELRLRGPRSTGKRGGVRYVIYAHHGVTGAGTDGGRLNACKRLRNNADADIYIMAHVHKPISTFDEEMAVSNSGNPHMRKRYYVVNGAMLDRVIDWRIPSLTYAAKGAMAPVPQRFARIRLGANVDKGKDIFVTT